MWYSGFWFVSNIKYENFFLFYFYGYLGSVLWFFLFVDLWRVFWVFMEVEYRRVFVFGVIYRLRFVVLCGGFC